MELVQKGTTIYRERGAKLGYLFYTFFKIGCISFGGYMALVSLMQEIMAERDGTVDHEVIMDSITVATLIPGPLAVNIVAYTGYHLKGKMGAIVSVFAVLLPACSLMLALAWIYFGYAYKFEWAGVMHFVVATVSAIILSTGYNLYKKVIGKNYTKALLCLVVIIITVIASNYLITIAMIFAGAIVGIMINRNSSKSLVVLNKTNKLTINTGYAVLLVYGIINEFLFLTYSFKSYNNILLKMLIAFSGISLSLFGGGYVMIPLMQSLFVNNLHWLSSREFIDAIAFSQATPGPILVSATFIGYKLAGVIGAIVATVAMFAPSAILMIIVSKLFKKNKEYTLVKQMISGIQIVVVGLIVASAIKLLGQQPFSISIAVVTAAALLLSIKYKISPVYLIIGSIGIGIVTNYII